ncbi:MAG: preprotein translocase subunit SecG [Methylacidiphilales bacterium]|nr:preprotein translocase subunit SecG [Candidatus Methylacidiphilales bacterium]
MVTILIYIITGFFVVCSLLLTFVVLMQRPRSEGLGAAFGGGMTESLFGAQTTDVLTKITIWLAALFFLCTLSLAVLHAKRSSTSDLAKALKAKAAIEQKTRESNKAENPAPVETQAAKAPATSTAAGASVPPAPATAPAPAKK